MATSYLCDECRPPKGDGWHYRVDPENPDGDLIAEPCPNKAIEKQAEKAQELAKIAQKDAWAAAQQIIRDCAETMPTLDANHIRDLFDDARIPTTLRGLAFQWAAKHGLIEQFDRTQSSEASTRHGIGVWRSLVYGRRSA